MNLRANRHAAGERFDVDDSFAQRGQVERHDVEAKVQVGPESPESDGLFEIDVARHDEPCLTVLRFRAADWLKLAGFDDAQERRLLFQPECVDLIKQQRAFANRCKFTDFRSVGACERTL